MHARTSDYDDYSAEYAASVGQQEQGGVAGDPFGILPRLLELLGDVAGRSVLDAGCGEGYLARVLTANGARVTGIDLSPRLIAMAREKDTEGQIEYRVGDLSQPLPDHVDRFDAVASYLVLNDVEDYRGFAPPSRPSSNSVDGWRWRSTTRTAPSSASTSPTISIQMR